MQSVPTFTRRHTTSRAIAALTLREMSTAYSRSPGGALWLLLEPVAAIALLSVLFSLILRAPSLGDNFPLFYATGFLPFALYTRGSMRIGMILSAARGVLQFPVITMFDAILARLIVAVITSILTMCLLIGGIHIFFGLTLNLDPLKAFNAVAMAAALAGGVGTLNAYLFRAFPVWQQIWSIANRPMFIISGIIFIYEDLPVSEMREWLLWNPVFHVTGMMRAALYPTYDPAWIQPAFVYGIAAGCAVLGLILLNRNHDDLLNA